MDPSDLYGLPLERFTAARNELAKALRKAGQRDQATAVRKLRKPTVAAWAVNQLVRTQRRDVQTLFAAGDALQAAQADLLQRKAGREALHQASDDERTAVDRLIQKARGLLDDDGHEPTAATIDRVAETLHAAAIDPEARAHVEPAALERELRHVGLGQVARERRDAERRLGS